MFVMVIFMVAVGVGAVLALISGYHGLREGLIRRNRVG